jgi:CDP-diacylglycerol--glycerol-3-phosphate 3-phosphatidyltransferase
MIPADEYLLIVTSDNNLRLLRSWRAAAALGLLIPIAGFAATAYYWQSVYAWRWMLTSLVIVVYILVILKTGLRSNHRLNDTRLLPGLGIGNWITFTRAILIAILAGLLVVPWPEFTAKFLWCLWLPGTIYLLAAILDYFDGFAARITDHQTRLGQDFDTKVDALGLFFAAFVAIKIGQLPIFYLSVGGAYYLFKIGIWYRRKFSKPLIELKPYPQARLMAGLQMGFVSAALFPVLRPPITTVAAVVFMIPFLLGFLRDWLVICGHLATGECQMANWEIKLYRLVTGWFPLFLRFIIIITGFTIGYKTLSTASGLNDKIASSVLSLPDSTVYIFVIILFIFVGLGLCGRLSAVFLCFSCGHLILSGVNGLGSYTVFVAACCLMMTGSGLLSLWQPEEKIVLGNRYHDDYLLDCGYRL